MMKNIIVGILLLSSSLLAQKAIFLEVVSENMIKIKYKDRVQTVHLSGIELFAKANNATRSISLDKKEEFKQAALSYISTHLKAGDELRYAVVYQDNRGIKKIWLDNDDLNYRMIRDGYAILDLNDPLLPSSLKMRMSRAMKYAKDRKLGLWAKNENSLLALVDKSRHMCGWHNQKYVAGITRELILEELRAALPKSVRTKQDRYLAMK